MKPINLFDLYSENKLIEKDFLKISKNFIESQTLL